MAKIFFVLLFAPCIFALGGWKNIDVSDDVVQHIASSSCSYLDSAEGSEKHSTLGGVIRARKQLVNGWNYKITITRAITSCSSNSLEFDRCPIEKLQECTISAYVSFNNRTEIKDFKCKDKTDSTVHRPMMAGGVSPGNVNDKDVKDAADFATATISARSNSMYKSLLIEVNRVSKQVVAGTRYRMSITIGETQCKNDGATNPIPTLADCSLTDAKRGRRCKIDVVDAPWMQPRYKLLNFSCSEFTALNLNRHKRSLVETMQGPLLVKTPMLQLGGDGHDLYRGSFVAFKAKWNKVYESEDVERMRYGIFLDNMKKVELLQKTERGTAVYGATKFADLTAEEFKKMYTGFRPDLQKEQLPVAETPNYKAPTEFDWRTKNAVTEVKNQGSCGSCWAFSTTGNIEGQWSVKKGKLVSLSEQELVDCDKVDQGCNGGLPSNAYKEIIRLGGLETEKEYPYEGRGEKCEFVKGDVRAYINSSTAISSDEAQMATWLAKNGPISIGINANAMQFYFGGISHPWKIFCNPNSLDHGVLIVGYGVKDGKTPYWIIKNSWGPSWGEKGYYIAYRGAGVCGLNKMTTSAIVL